MRYSDRFYRDFTTTLRWTSFKIKVETSDLYIRARKDLSLHAEKKVRQLRNELMKHIEEIPDFLTSFKPLPLCNGAPLVALMMYQASEQAAVGPMAAVAGAIAELTGRELLNDTDEIIVENGGDIWMKLIEPAEITIYAGEYRFPGKLHILIRPENTPCGICTSSAKIGNSVSFGKADAVTVIAPDAALADALATECCNRIRTARDIERAIDFGMDHGAQGILTVYGDTLGVKGNIEFIQ